MVVAVNPATSTCDLGPKMTPLELLRKTCPLAVIFPMICEGSELSTRFRVTEEEEG